MTVAVFNACECGSVLSGAIIVIKLSDHPCNGAQSNPLCIHSNDVTTNIPALGMRGKAWITCRITTSKTSFKAKLPEKFFLLHIENLHSLRRLQLVDLSFQHQLRSFVDCNRDLLREIGISAYCATQLR